MRRNWGETAMGFVVIVFALLFVAYVLRVGGVGGATAGYDLTARVGDAGALAPGAKVESGQLSPLNPTCASRTPTAERVTLPVLVRR